MGLKNFSQWKKFIQHLFPDSILSNSEQFKDAMESVDVVLADLNIVTHNVARASFARRNFDFRLRFFIPDQFKAFPNTKTFIGTMDDPLNVPNAKKVEQGRRDEEKIKKGEVFTSEELRALGKHAFLTKHDETSFNVIKRVMRDRYEKKKASSNKKRRTRNGEERTEEKKQQMERDEIFALFLDLCMATRTTRKDVLQYATKQFLRVPKGGLVEGRSILLDGVLYPKEPRSTLYCEDPDESVTYVSKDDITGEFYDAVIGPCLFAMTEEIIIHYSDYETKHVGEGDIKCACWIGKCAEEKKSVYFQCCDTDVFVILLMIFDFLDKKELDLPILYLDMSTSNLPPFSEDMTREEYYESLVSKRQVFKMHRLYYSLRAELPKIWKGVKNPILTLCFGMMACGSDFFQSPNNIGINTIVKSVFSGGYSILDNVISLQFCDSDSLPAVILNETNLFRFWKFCYSVLKISSIRKDKAIHSKPLDDILKEVEKARKIFNPAPQRKNSTLKRERTELVHITEDLDPIDSLRGIGDERRAEEILRETLSMERSTEEMFNLLKNNYVFSQEKLFSLFTGVQKPSDDKEIYALSRRWAWNINYWLFSFRCTFSDISVIPAKDGRSNFGFAKKKDLSTGDFIIELDQDIYCTI